MSPIPLGIFAVAGAAADPAMELISTTILTSTTKNVVFASVPQTYKHLQIRMVARGETTTGEAALIKFNGTTSALYAQHMLRYDNNGIAGSGSASISNIPIYGFSGGSNNTGSFGAGIFDIVDYSSTVKNKTLRGFAGVIEPAPYFNIGLYSGLMFSTVAISGIEITASYSAGWIAGSRFSLYGIKG